MGNRKPTPQAGPHLDVQPLTMHVRDITPDVVLVTEHIMMNYTFVKLLTVFRRDGYK